MRPPTYGGLKKLQEYCATAGFPLEACRGEIFANTNHVSNRLHPAPTNFTLAGTVVDLVEKAEKEAFRKVTDISLTDSKSLRQLIFHRTPLNTNSQSFIYFIHACVADQSPESKYFNLWVTQHRQVIEKVAWCGLPSFTIPEYYNFRFNPEKYAQQVFLS
jgi:hypothetical protein